MKKIVIILTALSCIMYVASCTKADDVYINNQRPNSTDSNFMVMAAYGNWDEINLGQLALTNSSNDTVKMFAQQMITDHTAAEKGLDSLGARYNIILPTTIDSAHAAIKVQLQALTGRSFDSAYIKGQVNDHVKTTNLFTGEITGGSLMDVKNFAANKLPVIIMHLQMADSIAVNYK